MLTSVSIVPSSTILSQLSVSIDPAVVCVLPYFLSRASSSEIMILFLTYSLNELDKDKKSYYYTIEVIKI